MHENEDSQVEEGNPLDYQCNELGYELDSAEYSVAHKDSVFEEKDM